MGMYRYVLINNEKSRYSNNKLNIAFITFLKLFFCTNHTSAFLLKYIKNYYYFYFIVEYVHIYNLLDFYNINKILHTKKNTYLNDTLGHYGAFPVTSIIN